MKHLFYISAILLFSLTTVKAQKPITISEDSVRFGNRYFPGFWVSIPEVNTEVVKANWIKTIQKGTKSKVKIDKNEFTLFGAIIRDFYASSVNIMSKAVDNDSLTQLFVSVETTRDNFIGKTSVEYDKLNKYLKEFAKNQYVTLVKVQLSAEESKLSDLEKDLKSKRKSNDKTERDIQSSRRLVSEEHDRINAIKKNIEATDASIDATTSLISTATDKVAKNAKEGELKDLKKNKKGFLKDVNKAENSISKANFDIEDNTKKIELNKSFLQELGERINQQKLVTDKFREKLKAIEAY